MLVLLAVGAAYALVLLLPTTGEAQSSRLHVGPERCKVCHEYQYQVWKNGPHARATKRLNDKQRVDARCAQCHLTSATMTAEGQGGITCEHCHGPGRYYQREYVMRDKELASLVGLIAKPNASSCTTCHGEGAPNIKPFTFDAAWPLIDHRSPPAPATR